MKSEPDNLTSELLAKLCVEQTIKQNKPSPDNPLCFELLRRAIGQEEDEAIQYVFDIYLKFWSRYWIRNEHEFESHALTADDFKSRAFSIFYERFKGDAFETFKSQGAVLGFMYRTVINLIAAHFRSAEQRHRQPPFTNPDRPDPLKMVEGNNNPEKEVEIKLLREKIDKRIKILLPDEDDRIFYDLWGKQRLSRAEIVREIPDICPDTNRVRVRAQTITRKFFVDGTLRALLIDLWHHKR